MSDDWILIISPLASHIDERGDLMCKEYRSDRAAHQQGVGSYV